MAEKTTTKAPASKAAAATKTAPVAGATGAATPAPKTRRVDTFRFAKAPGEGEKLAPQARVIVNTLSEHSQGLVREDLNKALEGKLTTRQPIGRIVTYYQKDLVTRGFISIESVEVAA